MCLWIKRPARTRSWWQKFCCFFKRSFCYLSIGDCGMSGFRLFLEIQEILEIQHTVVLSTEYIKSRAVCHPLSPNFEVRNHPTGWRCCYSLGSGSTDCLEGFFCRFAFELTQAVLGALNDNRRFSVAGQKVTGDACLLLAHVENGHNMCKIDRLTLSYRDDDRDVQELVRLGMLTFDVLLQVRWSGYVMVLGCFCICLPDIVGDS